jgi:hypothetical protein
MRLAFLAAAIALTASAHAGPPLDHYRLHTAGELARVCSTHPSADDYTTAIAFCHGVLAGAYGYFIATTPEADRFSCPPKPAPTRTQVANGFVDWMKVHPQLINTGAIDALFRYAGEAFPCKR